MRQKRSYKCSAHILVRIQAPPPPRPPPRWIRLIRPLRDAKKLSASASWFFDVVTPSSKRSACFTQSYGVLVCGTGSVLYLHPCTGGTKYGAGGEEGGGPSFDLAPPVERMVIPAHPIQPPPPPVTTPNSPLCPSPPPPIPRPPIATPSSLAPLNLPTMSITTLRHHFLLIHLADRVNFLREQDRHHR